MPPPTLDTEAPEGVAKADYFSDIVEEATKPMPKGLFDDIVGESKSQKREKLNVQMRELRGAPAPKLVGGKPVALATEFGAAVGTAASEATKGAAAVTGLAEPTFAMDEPAFGTRQMIYGQSQMHKDWDLRRTDPGKMRSFIESSPVYKAGQTSQSFWNEMIEKYVPEEEKESVSHQMVRTAGGLVPALTGVTAPLMFGLMAAGNHFDQDYQAMIDAGVDKNEAAKKAADAAIMAGAKEVALWEFGPKALRKYVGDKVASRVGQTAARRWLGNVTSGAVTLAPVTAASAGTEAIISGKPIGEAGTEAATAFISGGVLGGVTGGMSTKPQMVRLTPQQQAMMRVARRNAPLAPATAKALEDQVKTAQVSEVKTVKPKEDLTLEGEKAKTPEEKEKPSAKGIRKDEGQVPRPGDATKTSKGEGGSDLEQPASQQPSGAASQETLKTQGLSGEKITAAAVQHPETGEWWQGPHHPAVEEHLSLPKTSREERNTPGYGFVVEDAEGNKRVAMRSEATEIARASGQLLDDYEPGTKLHSDMVTSKFEPGKTISETDQPVKPVDAEEEAYLKAERESIDSASAANKEAGLPHEVVAGKPSEGGEGDPFAIRKGELARPTKDGKGVLVNVRAVREWLTQFSPEDQPRVLKSLFTEEGIHGVARSVIKDEEAAALWKGLTGPERRMVETSYFGDLRKEARPTYTDAQLGHEYLRRVMQRLMGMDVREVIEAKARGEGWAKEATINTIERVIQWLRTKLPGKTNEMLRGMISKLQENIDVAKSGNAPEGAGAGEQPAAFAKDRPDRTPDDVLKGMIVSESKKNFTKAVKNIPSLSGANLDLAHLDVMDAASDIVEHGGSLTDQEQRSMARSALYLAENAIREKQAAIESRRAEIPDVERRIKQYGAYNIPGDIRLKDAQEQKRSIEEVVNRNTAEIEEHRKAIEEANKILGEESFPAAFKKEVTIRRPDGSEYQAELNGYWDFTPIGKGTVPSIGRKLEDGSLSHGALNEGEQIITPVPSFEEWSKQKGAQPAAVFKPWEKDAAESRITDLKFSIHDADQHIAYLQRVAASPNISQEAKDDANERIQETLETRKSIESDIADLQQKIDMSGGAELNFPAAFNKGDQKKVDALLDQMNKLQIARPYPNFPFNDEKHLLESIEDSAASPDWESWTYWTPQQVELIKKLWAENEDSSLGRLSMAKASLARLRQFSETMNRPISDEEYSKLAESDPQMHLLSPAEGESMQSDIESVQSEAIQKAEKIIQELQSGIQSFPAAFNKRKRAELGSEKMPGFEDLITGKKPSAGPQYQKEQPEGTAAGRPLRAKGITEEEFQKGREELYAVKYPAPTIGAISQSITDYLNTGEMMAEGLAAAKEAARPTEPTHLTTTDLEKLAQKATAKPPTVARAARFATPSFKNIYAKLQEKFGPMLQRGQALDAWRGALATFFVGNPDLKIPPASGKSIEALRDVMGMQRNYGTREIPDAEDIGRRAMQRDLKVAILDSRKARATDMLQRAFQLEQLASHAPTQKPSAPSERLKQGGLFGEVPQPKAKAKDVMTKSELLFKAESLRTQADLLMEGEDLAGESAPIVRAHTSQESRAMAGQRYRYKVISGILDRLNREAETEKAPLDRKSFTDDDLGWWRQAPHSVVQIIGDADRKNLDTLGKALTQGARAGEDRPVSETRRITALLDTKTNQVDLVSTYDDPHRGVVMVDPLAPTGMRPNILLEDALHRGRFQPIMSFLLDEPVQNFHQRFLEEKAEGGKTGLGVFQRELGNPASARAAREADIGESFWENMVSQMPMEVAEQEHGLVEPSVVLEKAFMGPTLSDIIEGRPSSAVERGEGGGFMGQAAQVARGEAGVGRGEIQAAKRIPITDTEALNLLGHIMDKGPGFDSPQAVFQSLLALREEKNWQIISAYQKLYDAFRQSRPDLSPLDALEKLGDKLYENWTLDPSEEAFVQKAMAIAGPKDTESVRPGQTKGVPTQPRKGYETPVISPAGPELVQPGELPASTGGETAAEAPPFAGPPEEGKLSPQDQARVQMIAAREHPPRFSSTLYRQLAEREVPKERYTMAPKPAGEDITKDWPDGPAAFYKNAQEAKRRAQDEFIRTGAQIAAAATRHSTVEDIHRLADGMENTGRQYALGAGNAVRAASMEDLPADMRKLVVEGPVQTGHTRTTIGEEKGRFSISRIKAVRAAKAEATKQREAALAVMATMTRMPNGAVIPVFKKLNAFRTSLQSAIGRAESMIAQGGWRNRLVGAKWKAAAERLMQGIETAEQNWVHTTERDPKTGANLWGKTPLTRTVQALQREFRDELNWENDNGFGINDREAYMPGLYEGEFWNDDQIMWGHMKILGKLYRKPKVFRNYYDAIREGPYIPASYDPADLLQHRVGAGRFRTARMMWANALKDLIDPVSGKPVAVNPDPIFGPVEEAKVQIPDPNDPNKIIDVPIAGATVTDPKTGASGTAGSLLQPTDWKSPSREYDLVRVDGKIKGKPLAVRHAYIDAVKAAMMESGVTKSPLGAAALQVTNILKHGALLVLDSFHPSRLAQYALAPSAFGHKRAFSSGGFSALNYRAKDLPKAVSSGLVSQRGADWALGKITVIDRGQRVTMTRQDLASRMVSSGLNTVKISDALYKDAVSSVPGVGKWWHKTISPVNKMVFDYIVPGLATEVAVRAVEKMNAERPDIPLDSLLKDVLRDTNTIYGSLGRQGIFKNPTWRDLAQIFLLAPVWQEALIQKEIRGYSRLPGSIESLGRKGLAALGADVDTKANVSQKLMGKMTGNVLGRQGLPAGGLLGRTIAGGLFGYFALTQVANLIFRHHLTFQNPEEGHKLDAAIQVGDETVWLSPLSVFGEVMHDVIRLGESKPKVWDAITQMGANRLGPVGRMAHVLGSGENPSGQKITTTPGVLKTAASQLAVTPISITTPASWVAGKLGLGSTVTGGQLTQRVLGSVGIKTQLGESEYQQMIHKAQKFMDENKLKKETGWEQVQTDEPSYSKLRVALHKNDTGAANTQITELLKTHTPDQIWRAMQLWAKRPYTGSKDWEQYFVSSLTPQEQEIYWKSNLQRQDVLDRFLNVMSNHK